MKREGDIIAFESDGPRGEFEGAVLQQATLQPLAVELSQVVRRFEMELHNVLLKLRAAPKGRVVSDRWIPVLRDAGFLGPDETAWYDWIQQRFVVEKVVAGGRRRKRKSKAK